MNKLFIFGISIVLLGAGCLSGRISGEGTVRNGGGAGVEDGAGQTNGAPPAIELSASGQSVAGVEGSYCYGPRCVDKIGPIELVAEFGLDFTAASRDMEFSSKGDLSAMSVSVLNEDGNIFHETELTQDASGSFEYTVPMTVPPGNYYIVAFAQFEAGGDVSYVFPVTLGL